MVKKSGAVKKTKEAKKTQAPKIASVGKCHFCGETVAKKQIFPHLKKHLDEKTVLAPAAPTTKKSAAAKKSGGVSYLIAVETPSPYSPMFLALWIDGAAKLKDLDTFLRNIWLDCCGHMSAFKDPHFKGGFSDDAFFAGEELLLDGKEEAYEKLMEKEGQVSKYRRAVEVFDTYPTLDYEYDFGSTTELRIIVKEKFSRPAGKKIVLLSRNEPLDIICPNCGKNPAVVICAVHAYEDVGMLCDACADKHAKKCEDFRDGAALPVLNSPRMGQCAYTGGLIDQARDGIKESKWTAEE